MAGLVFDVKNVKKVPIELVLPNSWNPKEENTPEYLRIKEGIRLKGLRGAIPVRQRTDNGEVWYEIIDGQQRRTAAQELGFAELYIYDHGEVSEKDAKELTIWYQQQVPFSRVDEAYLVSSLVDDYGANNLELPYTPHELDALVGLAHFDFDSAMQATDMESPIDDSVVFSLQMSPEQLALVQSKLHNYSEQNGLPIVESLVDVLTKYV